MARQSYGFIIEGIEPLDIDLHGERARREFWRAVVAIGLAEKDAELAQGRDRFGRRMKPIAPSTRKSRQSWTGFADPDAPPLTPAYGESRTRVLLDGRAHANRAEFFWRADPITGKPWSRTLAIHRAGGRRLPVRDVIGISPAALRRVKAAAWKQWEAFKKGAQANARRPAPGRINVPQAPARIEVVGRTDFQNAVFGAGGGKARAERALAAGQATGFRNFEPPSDAAGPGRPRPTPTPKPRLPVNPVPTLRVASPVRRKAPPTVFVSPPPPPSQPATTTPTPPERIPRRRPEPRPMAANATVSVEPYGADRMDATVRRIFGRDLTHAQLAALGGAPDGSTVRLAIDSGHGTGHERLEISWRIAGHTGYDPWTAQRTIRQGPAGAGAIVHNDYFKLPSTHQKGGHALDSFGRQVEALKRLGAKEIETLAYRNDPNWIGYKVWPKFGYDGAIPDGLRSHLPAGLKRARKVSDLYRTEKGKEWWESHGESFDAIFDLTPGSRSLQRWNAYRKMKKEKAGGTTPT